MIIKILGILDIISGLLFWLGSFFHIIPDQIIILIVFYLIIKGVIFIISKDIASILDIISGLVIYLSMSFNLPAFVIIIVTFFLLQKGIFSLVA